tara:strand:+ start:319 stop:1002 length:684 start_codon:yes stop_codon:yes gene_type:complete
MKKKLYIQFETNFFDKIINQKRIEMINLIYKKIKVLNIRHLLDIGTTEDSSAKSSNIFCKMLNKIPIHKSISNQKITNKRFMKCLKKSITSNFSQKNIQDFKCDLVISSATIEHVGNFQNQVSKIKNMISLSNQYVVISTPNRFYPIELHTKLPLIHWLPKKIFRRILLFFNMKYFADEKNLNLLSKSELIEILNTFSKKIDYKIYNISFLGFVSNFLVICKIKKIN